MDSGADRDPDKDYGNYRIKKNGQILRPIPKPVDKHAQRQGAR